MAFNTGFDKHKIVNIFLSIIFSICFWVPTTYVLVEISKLSDQEPNIFIHRIISLRITSLEIAQKVLSGHLKKDKTNVLMENGSLMTVKSIAECSPWSILQYFWPALSDNWYWKPSLVFFLSCRLRQVLLYTYRSMCTYLFQLNMIYVALNICHECNQDILIWSLRLRKWKYV